MSENLKEFLVSLGFRVDERSYEGWRQALAGVDKLMVRAVAALSGAATAVAALVRRTSVDFDALNFSAQRLGTSVKMLEGYLYALKQVGAGNARPLEGFARQLRLLPSAEGIVNLLGVATRQGGALRDTGDVLMDVIDALDKQDYLRASHNAGLLGIPDAEYRKLRGRGDAIRAYIEETKARAKAMGVNPDALGVQSALLMASARGVAADLDLVLSLIAASLAPVMIPLIERIHGWLIDNKDRIVSFLRKLVDAVAAVMVDLGGLLTRLDPVDKAVSDFGRQEGAMSSAVKIIGGGFLLIWATRIGRVTGLLATGFLALRALFKDGEAQAATVQAVEVVAPSGRRSTFLARVGSLLGFPDEGAEPASKENADKGSGDKSQAEGGASKGDRGAPVGTLADVRARFAEELKDPRVAARVYAYTEAEVGGQGPEAQQAFIESIMNRAAARGQTLEQTLSAPSGYFPPTTHRKARAYMGNPRLTDKYQGLLGDVLGGSNISDYATGNASGGVMFNQGPQTKSFGGERFGIEGPDVDWARKVREQDLKSRPPSDQSTPPKSEKGVFLNSLESRPIVAEADVLHGQFVQETYIRVDGDADPFLTAQSVGREQAAVNSRIVDTSARMFA